VAQLSFYAEAKESAIRIRGTYLMHLIKAESLRSASVPLTLVGARVGIVCNESKLVGSAHVPKFELS
jgi:hypothetical protein